MRTIHGERCRRISEKYLRCLDARKDGIKQFPLMPPLKLSRPWDFTSFLYFVCFLVILFFCRPSYRLLMTFWIVSYLNESSDTNRRFHDLECHAFHFRSKEKSNVLRVRWTVPPFLNIVLGNTFSLRWSVPSFLIDFSSSFLNRFFSSSFSLFFVCKLIISDKKPNVKHYF